MRAYYLTVLLLFFTFSGPAEASAKLVATPNRSQITQYERVEWTLAGAPEVVAPLDPAVVTVDLELTAPSGRQLAMPGFATRAVETVVSTDAGTTGFAPEYRAVGAWSWAVRFCPAEAGAYRGRIVVRQAGKESGAAAVNFTVAPSGGRGFIRLAPLNPQAFAYDDGSGFFAIGENLCFASAGNGDRDRLAAYRKWLDQLHANGGNFIRIWLGADWSFGLEGSRPYDYNQGTAHLIDAIQRLCEERGIAIKFCFDYVRSFTPGRLYYRADYPYMAANGGPADTFAAMLASPTAQRQWQALQRYIVARWGASTSTFTWELWNEMNETEASDGLVVAWSRMMAAHLKQIDPYGHLVSTSLGSEGDDPALWNAPEIDYANYHDYGGARQTDRTQYDLYWAPLVRMSAAYGKPVLLNEGGLVDEKWEAYAPATHPRFRPGGPKDVRGIAFHELLWAGVFGSGCGTGMTWWWDTTVDAYQLYPQFRVVRRFVAGLPLHLAPTTASQPRTNRENLTAYARTGPWGSMVWVVNRRDSWRPVVLEGRALERVTVGQVTVPLPGPGDYRVGYVDPWTGATLVEQRVSAAGDSIELHLPAFTIDLLVRVERVPSRQ